jgi:NAD(P)-dependent dehydrogenase (short-subunit alcohol dehydrogenase family)
VSASRDLEGQVVVLTGAAGGLGSAMAWEFARSGASLVLLDLPGAALDALAAELSADGHECTAQGFDITDASACEAAVGAAIDRFGGVDVLVNNAGITHRSPFTETTVDVIRNVMEVNLFGSLHCTRAALDSLTARRGRIVVISSVAGFAPLYGRTGYAASKHALIGLFSSLRTELASDGVGVTIVCPTFIRTAIDVNALDADGKPTAHPQSTVGKVAEPDDVARRIVQGTAAGRDWIFNTGMGRAARILSAVAPGLYETIMTRSLRSELQRS